MWFCTKFEQVEIEPKRKWICNFLNCFSCKQSKTCQTILNAQHPPSWLFIKIVKYRMFSTKYESCYSPGISMWFCMIFEQVEFEQQRKWVCNLLNDFSCKQSTTCQNKYWSTTWDPPTSSYIEIVKYHVFCHHNEWFHGIFVWFRTIFEQVKFDQKRKWVCNFLNYFVCKKSETLQKNLDPQIPPDQQI